MLSRRWTWSTKSYVAAGLGNRSENYLFSCKSLLRMYWNGWGRNQRKLVDEWHWEVKTHKNTMTTLSIENSHSHELKPNRSTQLIKRKISPFHDKDLLPPK